MAAYNEGYAACENGEGLQTNPYKHNPLKHEWREGWHDAQDCLAYYTNTKEDFKSFVWLAITVLGMLAVALVIYNLATDL